MASCVGSVKLAVLLSLPAFLLLLLALSSNSGLEEGGTVNSKYLYSPLSSPPSSPAVSGALLGDRDKSLRRILVTGSAGFIGYHVSKALSQHWGSTVVGLDNFNGYYDAQLKKDRANELIKLGVRQYRGDVCDSTLLSHLFTKHRFTDVVHLAAQAGVRHSLEQPISFVRSNIQCFLTLLDMMADQKVRAQLVFASSSSVYGVDAPLPFSVSSPPHSFTNVYAASKMTNELFAEAYCSQHGLKAVGLRLFTVYGPWGRPDMAVYKFAKQIAEGLPVPMFDSPQPLMRDFTFVNDTVGGVLAALEYMPTRCGEIYNIGTGRPLTLNTMLKQLEEELQMTAKIELLPLPPSDLQSTYADVSETKRVLGVEAAVSLREGIREFVSWFKWYSKKRSMFGEEKSVLLDEAIKEGDRDVAAAYRLKLENTNKNDRKRMEDLRQRYDDFAEETGRKVQNMRKSSFTFHSGVDSPGGTVIKAPGYLGNIEFLKDRCLQIDQCVAFNSMAELKNKLQPQHLWTRTAEGKGEGLYIADINMCDSDLHDCDRHAHCIHQGPASYSCNCEAGYVKLGKQCVQKYLENDVTSAEWVWQLSDHLGGRSWDNIAEGQPFVFFQGLDSVGGDYLVVEGGVGDVERLKEACLKTHHCLAFNTNGILKHSLLPPSKWIRWTDHAQRGIYVRDINYCSLDLEECPTLSRCVRAAPANYSCVCKAPYSIEVSGSALRCSRRQAKETDLVHVIVSVDQEHFPGLVGVVSSALFHASQPERLKFHVVLSEGEESILRSYLRCYGYDNNPQLEITKLNTDWLNGKVKVYTDVNRVGNLASSANFGRFLFHEHFSELSRAIYLDADTAVLGDLGEFWRRLLSSRRMVLAIPRNSPSYGSLFSKRVKEKFQERYGFTFKDSDPTFNAGVYGINFDLWRSKNMLKEVQYWMEEQSREKLWEFGTQPIMLLALYHKWEELGPEWNVDGLGWKREVGEEVLRSAKLLHWNGKGKPWLEEGLHRDLWLPHLPLECGGRGSCILHNEEAEPHYTCRCREGYAGVDCRTVQGTL